MMIRNTILTLLLTAASFVANADQFISALDANGVATNTSIFENELGEVTKVRYDIDATTLSGDYEQIDIHQSGVPLGAYCVGGYCLQSPEYTGQFGYIKVSSSGTVQVEYQGGNAPDRRKWIEIEFRAGFRFVEFELKSMTFSLRPPTGGEEDVQIYTPVIEKISNAPSAITLVSPGETPDNSINTKTPSFRWLVDPKSEWYLLWVEKDDANSTIVFKKWYPASFCANDVGKCRVGTGVSFPDSYHWWVAGWNEEYALGPWGPGQRFHYKEPGPILF